MQVGGRRQLVCPPDLAYGPAGGGHRLSGKTLIFVIDLLDVGWQRPPRGGRAAAADARTAAKRSGRRAPPRPIVHSATGVAPGRRQDRRGQVRPAGAGESSAEACAPTRSPSRHVEHGPRCRPEHRHPSVGRQGVVRDAVVALPRSASEIRRARHRAAVPDRRGVDRLTTATPQKPQRVPVPRLPGPCTTTATSASRLPGRQQPVVDRHRLEVATERLADGTDAGEPTGPRSALDGPRERERKRTAVGGDVRDGRVGTTRRTPATSLGARSEGLR